MRKTQILSLALTLLFSFEFCSIALADPSPSREIFDGTLKAHGPLIPPAKAPKTYSFLNEVMKRLETAQKKLYPALAGVRNQAFVLEVDSIEAYVTSLVKRKVGKQNLVFISRGLIDQLWRDAKGDEALFQKKIIGALAHEMAHPIDKIDPSSLEKAGKSVQLLELSTDHEALKLLKEADLPLDSVYEVLQSVLEQSDKPSPISILQAHQSTHPEKEVRLGAQRVELTLDRFEEGEWTSLPLEAKTEGIHEELAKVQTPWDPYKIGRNKVWSLDELLDELAKFPEVDGLNIEPHMVKSVKFNFLVSQLNLELQKPGIKLSSIQNKKLVGIYARITKYELPPLYGEAESVLQLKYIRLPMAVETAKSVTIYQTPKFKSDLVEAVSKFPYSVIPSQTLLRTGIFTPENYWDTWKNYQLNGVKENFRVPENLWHSLGNHWENLNLSDQLDFAHALWQNEISHFTDGQKLTFEMNRIDRRGNEFLFSAVDKEMTFPGDAAKMKEIAAAIWKDRGIYAAADLRNRNGGDRWASIFKSLGISPEEGRQQLRQSFFQFVDSPAYQDFLKIPFSSDEMNNPASIVPRPWVDESVLKKIEASARQPKLKDLSDSIKKLRAVAVRRVPGDLPGQQFRAKLLISLETEIPTGLDQFEKIFRRATQFTYGTVEGFGLPYSKSPLAAEIISSAKIPVKEKRALLSNIFLHFERPDPGINYSPFYFLRWVDPAEIPNEKGRSILAILRKNGLVGSTSSFLRDAANAANIGSESVEKSFFSLVTGLAEDIKGELSELERSAMSAADKKKSLMTFAENIFDPFGRGKYKAGLVKHSTALRDLQVEVIRQAKSLPLSQMEKQKLFGQITSFMATRESDELAKEIFHGLRPNEKWKLLEEGRVASVKRRLDFLAEVQRPILTEMEKSGDLRKLPRILATVQKIVPENTGVKDDYLESIAWKTDAQSEKSLAFIDQFKASNLVNVGEKTVNQISSLSEYVRNMSPEGKDALIAFVRNPLEFPPTLDKELDRLTAWLSGEAKAEAMAQIRQKLLNTVVDLSAEERVPILDNLLSSGGKELTPTYQSEIAQKFLGVKTGTRHETMLLSYLKNIPAYERFPTLAYMISISDGKGKMSALPIFEAHRAVGKKGGQLGSTWQLFSDEVNEELQSLKDRAKPLTKRQIVRLLKERLSPEEFALIEGVREIKGSASVKSVVEVVLRDRSSTVFGIRYPKADSQIHGNLNRGQGFLKEFFQHESD